MTTNHVRSGRAFWLLCFFLCLPALVQAGAYPITADLRIRAVIDTEDRGPIEAVWQPGGDSYTPRGDRVVWGYFHADPEDVSWGSPGNPDLYAKIWYDVSGGVNAAFFHASVPDIEIYTDYPSDGVWDQHSVAALDARLVQHAYGKDAAPVAGPSGGLWEGTIRSETLQESARLVGIMSEEGEFAFLPVSGETFVLGLGQAAVVDGQLQATVEAFDAASGAYVGTSTLQGSQVSGASIVGTYTSSWGDSGEFALSYDENYEIPVATADLAGTWDTLDHGTFLPDGGSVSISAAGVITGQNGEGCVVEGALSVVDPAYSVLDLELTASRCGTGDGAYTGLAVYEPAAPLPQGVRDVLIVIMDNGRIATVDVIVRP